MRKDYRLVKLIIASLFFFHLFCDRCEAQTYGLGFFSHEVVADRRTSLDLFPDKGFNSSRDFQISFDMSFLPDKKDYFGYIFRLIENGNRNIDLLFNKRNLTGASPTDPNHFKLVVGDQFTSIGFNIPPDQLLNHWTRITLDFDVEKNRIIVEVNKKRYVETKVKLNRVSIYKLVFGADNNNNFTNSDCSPIKVRNIKLVSDGTLKYFWPLNELSGNTAHELIQNSKGLVTNPLWIRSLHRKWTLEDSFETKGIASVAFNPRDNLLYIIGKDSIWNFNAGDFEKQGSIYNSGELNLLFSNQSIYNSYDHTLYNFYIDNLNKTVSKFDNNTKRWDKNSHYIPIIDYWHSNCFFSKQDSSLYIIGGYGRMTYKNNVFRYHLPTKSWENVKTKGDYYYPRYLAACGTTDSGKTAYLLGGYGSYSGQQVLNPKNLYDLMRFDVKTKTFKELYKLKIPGDGFAFANSMIIDEKTQTFTALIFPNHEFNSHLQLFIGSLIKPTYKIIESEIPYNFYDIHSFANLFYSPVSHLLLAVTLFRSDAENSLVHIYSLSSPPDTLALQSVIIPAASGFHPYIILILAGAGIALTFVLIYFWRLAKRKTQLHLSGEHAPDQILGDAPKHTTTTFDSADEMLPTDRSSILLFGDLKLYTPTGEDLTGHFTSLVKELFVALIVYSLKSGRGISPEKLIELLWFDKSEISARNNRAANISKLKNVLSQMEHVRLSKDTGSWKMEIDFNFIYVDYKDFLQTTSNKKKLDREKIAHLMNITKRGRFLPSAVYPWLDQIKSEISNEIIHLYLQYANDMKDKEEPEFLIEIANQIFNFDSVNEEAMIIKCKALVLLGKHSLAKSTFLAFSKEYLALYNEEFKRDFQAVLLM